LKSHNPGNLYIAERVRSAIKNGEPVVALESTVISHGLPAPLNLEVAIACEQAVRDNGAVPATTGIVEGRIIAGLDEVQLKTFATSRESGGPKIAKVSLNNFAAVTVKRGWGATTVASSLRVAHLAGIRVFSTGGIGGVHRGANESFDVSADLTALSRFPLLCVCAGAKAILDLPKTLEYLETLGVPVVGMGTDELPAFYSRASGLSLDVRVESPEEAARLALDHWDCEGRGAVLVCAPIPEEYELPAREVEQAISQAISRAHAEGIRGKAITPFLLSEMERLTQGRTLRANRALLINNAAVAGRIAVALARICH
jgi:pseudouridine-5'-phosphate glycosidase